MKTIGNIQLVKLIREASLKDGSTIGLHQAKQIADALFDTGLVKFERNATVDYSFKRSA